MTDGARIIVRDFFGRAPELRKRFDEVLGDTRSTRPERFGWDLFHVEGQYSHLRTPAYLFFPPRLYRAFHERIVRWGRETLGCHDVSPTWLSLYVEGHEQRLHADVPHGPWAFVYSLTPPIARSRSPVFRGGETMLLRPRTLDYWRRFESGLDIEEAALIESIAPRFNQLLVFDGRVPHGVRRVEGTRDPLQGRLVIHGWFVEPRPFLAGPHKLRGARHAIESLSEVIEPELRRLGPIHGTLTLRISISGGGRVTRIETLMNSLRGLEGQAELANLHARIRELLRRADFGKAEGPSTLTLPLMFR